MISDDPRAGRVDPSFWSGRRVFVTGHTGFKGTWLVTWLTRMGADVAGFALDPGDTPSLFEATGVERDVRHAVGDIREADHLSRAMAAHRPDIVLHLAAQALVRAGYAAPAETYAVNVVGTAHVLDAVRHLDCVEATVVVTTDKCYENREWVWAYREDDRLGGSDPYSSSKACAEILVDSYRRSFAAGDDALGAVATARAGNVIGGGDWSQDRLVPDIVRARLADQHLTLRYPEAVRPWLHVLDPLAGYLVLAQRMVNDPTAAAAWNFAPDPSDEWTVARIVELFAAVWGGDGSWRQEEGAFPHEARALQLDSSRARAYLGWRPALTTEEAVTMTALWYLRNADGASARSLVDADIDEYERRTTT